jgi:hypothetical protein
MAAVGLWGKGFAVAAMKEFATGQYTGLCLFIWNERDSPQLWRVL